MVGWVGVWGGGGGRGWLMDIVPPTFSWKCLKCLTSIALRLECGYFDLFLLPLGTCQKLAGGRGGGNFKFGSGN